MVGPFQFLISSLDTIRILEQRREGLKISQSRAHRTLLSSWTLISDTFLWYTTLQADESIAAPGSKWWVPNGSEPQVPSSGAQSPLKLLCGILQTTGLVLDTVFEEMETQKSSDS